eukprot:COSAG04_NODE_21925_length_364_cov_1.173585_1_plen_56_part_10
MPRWMGFAYRGAPFYRGGWVLPLRGCAGGRGGWVPRLAAPWLGGCRWCILEAGSDE